MVTTIITGVAIIISIGVLIGIHIGLGYLFTDLAEKDKWFTLVPEGTIKTVMQGANFQKFIENIEGWHIDNKGGSNLTVTEKNGSTKNIVTRKYDVIPGEGGISLNKILYTTYGVHWLGRPPVKNILKYHLKWTKLEQKTKEDGSTSYDLILRDDSVNSIYFDSPYAMEFKDIAVGGNLRMNFKLLVSIRTFNPHRQLFEQLPHGSWLMRATVEVQSGFLNFAGAKHKEEGVLTEHTYEWFRKTPHNKEDSEFEKAMLALNTSLQEKVGVRISGVELKEFELVEDPKVREQLQALELEIHKTAVAKQAAETQFEQAMGQANADAIAGQGKEEYYRNIGTALDKSPGAKLFAVMEKIEKSGLRAIDNITTILNVGEDDKDPGKPVTAHEEPDYKPKYKKFGKKFERGDKTEKKKN